MLPRYKDITDLLKKGSTLEAQEQIMALREGALELQEENHELKLKIRELEEKQRTLDNWSSEKLKYSLVTPWGGSAQVYALNKSGNENETPHFLCTNCFQQTKKIILNPSSKAGWVYMNCPSCNSSVQTSSRRVGTPQYAEEYTLENN